VGPSDHPVGIGALPQGRFEVRPQDGGDWPEAGVGPAAESSQLVVRAQGRDQEGRSERPARECPGQIPELNERMGFVRIRNVGQSDLLQSRP
jgi:hypothetical protein